MLLMTGTVLALGAVFYAFKAYRENNTNTSIEGSNESQQKIAEEAMAALGKDSSDVEAHNRLADVLYDTSNWSDAIVQYRAVLRRDSTRVTALVDMGVCYFNLSDARDAERAFRLALVREPHHPIALYNLGIVYEQGGDSRASLGFYHQAFGSDPPEALKQPLMDAIARTAKAAGIKAPPLPGTGHPTPGGSP
jgi:tetratricopeptide (TPR) repeat protein